jgi:hypothetical protein
MSAQPTLSGKEQLAAHAWLWQRITRHLNDIFEGLTDIAVRRERFRRVILNAGLGPVIVGRHDGKPETYTECFERLFGEPLEPSKARARAHADARMCPTPDPQPGDLFT